MSNSHEALVEEIATLTAKLEGLEQHLSIKEHELSTQKKALHLLNDQMQALQTLNLGIFNVLESAQIYALVCESLVYKLKWDTAMVLSLKSDKVAVLASYQTTQVQMGHIQDFLGQNRDFLEAYANRHSISTYHSHDRTALALRALFHTDELIATPILYGEHLEGYLIVCAHSHENAHGRSQELDFMAQVASQVGHAIQNSQAFRDLEEQNVKLRQLDELKNSFISITSHQLRTPLSIVKWILSILQSDEKLKPMEEQYTMLVQAYQSNERLIRVVNDLLNVSRIQDGKLPYDPQLSDLKAILRDSCTNMLEVIEQHAITLEQDIPDDLSMVELDPLLFKEVLQNLLENAIDYNHPQGSIWIKVWEEEDKIYLSITSTGPGIKLEDQKKIFDQFYRSPDAMRLQPNGNGLGLYLCKAILRAHKGDITCQSAPGEKTTFLIHIPV